jgi:hypothetical protein
MQMWRGCLSIIGYFAELQERNAMTQTSEPGIKSEHSESERIRGNGAQTTTTERPAISDKSEHLQFADLETNSDFGFFHSAGNSVPASRLATAPGSSVRWNRLRIDQIAGTATALLFAGLAPALVMAALWQTAEVVPPVHFRHRARSRGSPWPATFFGVSSKGVDQHHDVRRLWLCRRCRAGRHHDLAYPARRALCERVGRWRASDHQRRHYSR